MLSDVLELSDIAGPLVALHNLFGFGREGDVLRHLIFLGNLHGEHLEQQDDIFSAFTQGRHLDGDGVQAVVEVFAELAVAYGSLNVDIRGSYDAHIGFAYFATAYTDVFAILQHAQQAGLCAQRQLAYLVEEESAAVGSSKIALMFADSTRKSALLVTEQFAIDGALGDAPTVDGEILTQTAQAVVVNQTGDNLFTHTALASDEY